MRSSLVYGVLSLVTGAAVAGCGGGSSEGGDDEPGKTPDAAVQNVVDAGPPGPDARTDRFRCIGAALPTTAPANVRISGKVVTLGNPPSPISNASVSMVKRAGDNLATGKSGADGAFDVSAPTGSKPADAFLRGSAATYLDTEAYPPSPWVADAKDLTVVLLKQAQLNAIMLSAGVQRLAGTGVLTLAVQDCDQKPVAGATVSVTANGKAVGKLAYVDGTKIDTAGKFTGDTGVAIIFNVPPGDVEVSATTSDSQKLRAHTLAVRADVATATSILP